MCYYQENKVCFITLYFSYKLDRNAIGKSHSRRLEHTSTYTLSVKKLRSLRYACCAHPTTQSNCTNCDWFLTYSTALVTPSDIIKMIWPPILLIYRRKSWEWWIWSALGFPGVLHLFQLKLPNVHCLASSRPCAEFVHAESFELRYCSL